MYRLVSAAVLLASACGSATDDRPATLDYITETILAPTCAMAECHSAFKAQVGDVYDTPEAARLTIVANSLAIPDDATNPGGAPLIQAVTIGLPSILDPSLGNIRMPYVSPMPDADIALIEKWIADGVPNAQCVANAQGRGCLTMNSGTAVVECSQDGNAGAVITTCSTGQICEYRRGNGQCVTP
jgi:hypothetical protein